MDIQYVQYTFVSKIAHRNKALVPEWWRIYASLLLFLLPVVTIAFIAVPGSVHANGDTIANDALRSGWYPTENRLTPALVSSANFGPLFDTAIDGQVYAQPLVSNGVLLIVSETNHIYGLDATTGAQIWERSLGTPFNPADVNCDDLTPSIGVTGTPVIDPATNHAYFFSKTYLKGSAAWYMHAVDVATGTEQRGFPLLIQGTATNDPKHTFNAKFELQRPGLVLSGGVVYAAFGGHCDRPPYEGWVAGVSTSGTFKTLWTDEAGISPTAQGSPDGGIWMAGSGLVSDGTGQILFSSGNGNVPPPNTPGHTDTPNTLGQSVVRLTAQSDGSLKATDFFAPYDADQLNIHDNDMGSGGLMELPPAYFGTPTYPHIALQAGKEGYLYMLNANDLGGRGQSIAHADAVINRIALGDGLWSKPSVWPGNGGYVYIVSARKGKASGNLDAYRYILDNTGKPTLKQAGSAPDAFGFGSSSPVISSQWTSPGSALVWSIWSSDGTGQGAQLRAYDAVPVNGVLNLRYSSAIGTASKFNGPLIENNRVYVATQDGHVLAFGETASPLFPLSGASLDFGTVIARQSSHGTLKLTAHSNVKVNAVTLDNAAFTLGTTTPVLPATLTTGQSIQIPVTFTPPTNYVQGADVSVKTSQGTIIFSVEGRGETPSSKLRVSLAPLSMGGALLGAGPLTVPLTLFNSGAQSGALTGSTLPHAPFSVSGLPALNAPIAPGASITMSVTFTPTSTGSFSDTLILMTTSGEIDIPLTATAGTGGVLTATPLTIDTGPVSVGSKQTVSFTLSNTGIRPVTITSSLPPHANVGFTALSTLPVGIVLQPGATIQERVVFAPANSDKVADSWVIGSNDGTGVKTINFTGTGLAISSHSNF